MDENVTRISKRRIPYIRRKIGFIFQDHHLLFDRTVFDNVALPLIIAGYRHQEIGRRVRAALDKVGLLQQGTALPDHPVRRRTAARGHCPRRRQQAPAAARG